ncbi:hypothetical protein P153DRAFT_404379 [Dothidotthia symphoricarpi CBS 119687]|uniref:Uncharacterized protein n=1 Tax=Dothidotthia symphoricarpi CBS 119687 TaxID=1392245 RepID=A0A6A6ABD8_9PLEO|nr:uncharacterized protein P153DRAFT_404379 [Dothidotthia symphoricarpi CBS 119687]KAF2128334.1 hypothetical protein P153DRAFT_404379 [Dothidotthia symphoricarpi CBS 119687]
MFSPDPEFDLFGEYTNEEVGSSPLLDLFVDSDMVRSETPLPTLDYAETLRAELFGASACVLESIEGFQYVETMPSAIQETAEGVLGDPFTTPPPSDFQPVANIQTSFGWASPSFSSPFGDIQGRIYTSAHLEPLEGLQPAFSVEPLPVSPDTESIPAGPSMQDLLAENARLRALVASHVEPSTPKMTPRKRTAGISSIEDDSPSKKVCPMTPATSDAAAQQTSVEALWSSSDPLEQQLEHQQELVTPMTHGPTTSVNTKLRFDGDYVAEELAKVQEFINTPPPPSPLLPRHTPSMIMPAPPKCAMLQASQPTRRQTFSHAGASASFSNDIPSSSVPKLAMTPQTSSPAAKKPRAKRAPAKKASEKIATVKKTPAKKRQRTKSAPASTHQRKRSVEEIYTLNFYDLSQEEKARLLLPLLQGIDPKAADVAEAEALVQTAQTQSSAYAPATMHPEQTAQNKATNARATDIQIPAATFPQQVSPITPTANTQVTRFPSKHTTRTMTPSQITELYSPQTAQFISLGFQPASLSPVQTNSSSSPAHVGEFDGSSRADVSAVLEHVTTTPQTVQVDEDAYFFTQLEQFNNGDHTIECMSLGQLATNNEATQLEADISVGSAQLNNAGHTPDADIEDVSFTLAPTADLLAFEAELDAVTNSPGSAAQFNSPFELDAIARFNSGFNDLDVHYPPQPDIPLSISQPRSQKLRKMKSSYVPDVPIAMMQHTIPRSATQHFCIPAADIGATRQREALEKAARLQAQGRKR